MSSAADMIASLKRNRLRRRKTIYSRGQIEGRRRSANNDVIESASPDVLDTIRKKMRKAKQVDTMKFVLILVATIALFATCYVAYFNQVVAQFLGH